MLLEIRCKQGRLQVLEEGVMRLQAPFNKVVWQLQCADVTGFTTRPGSIGMFDIVIRTAQSGPGYNIDAGKTDFVKLQALFPHLPAQNIVKEGNAWYHDLKTRAHIETYDNQKKMQKEVEAASHYGWMPQVSAGTAGHINVGRTATAAVLTGGWSLLLGASRSKDKVTLTFLRTPEWLAQNT